MLCAEQLIIVAYCHDGSILCRECGEGTPECKMGEALSAYEAGEYADANGLTCEDCEKEIVQAYEWTCPSCGADYCGSDAETAEEEYHETHNCGAVACTGKDTKDEDED